jgi:hypothetical protein
MPALVAGIHVIGSREIATWMAGSSPAMTVVLLNCYSGQKNRIRGTEAATMMISSGSPIRQ